MIKKNFTSCFNLGNENSLEKKKEEYFNDLGYDHFKPEKKSENHFEKYIFTRDFNDKKRSKR